MTSFGGQREHVERWMGAKVNIIKYFYTDSSGNLHYKCDEKSSRKLQEP